MHPAAYCFMDNCELIIDLLYAAISVIYTEYYFECGVLPVISDSQTFFSHTILNFCRLCSVCIPPTVPTVLFKLVEINSFFILSRWFILLRKYCVWFIVYI